MEARWLDRSLLSVSVQYPQLASKTDYAVTSNISLTGWHPVQARTSPTWLWISAKEISLRFMVPKLQ